MGILFNRQYRAANADDECQETTTRRFSWPIFGVWGGIAYFWEVIVAIWVLCMLIDAYNINWFTLAGILIATIVVYFVFWLIDIFFWAPRYRTRIVSAAELAFAPGYEGAGTYNAYGEYVVEDPAVIDYSRNVYRDLQHNQDQGHLQMVILAAIFVLIFLAIFLGQNGEATFQPLPAAFTNVDVMNYVKAKVFQILVLGIVAMSIALASNCLPSFIWRHLSAINVQYFTQNGKTIGLGSKKPKNLLK